MANDGISNPAQEAAVPKKATGGRPMGSKNKPMFTPEQCLHAADLLAAEGTRKAAAAYLGTSVQTSYTYVSAENVEAAKQRRAQNIANGVEVLPLQQRNVLSTGKRKGAAPQIDAKRHVEILRTLLSCNDYNEAARLENVNPRVIYRAIPAKTLQAVQGELKAANGQPITYMGQIIEPPAVKPPERKSGVAPALDETERAAARKALLEGQSAEEIALKHNISPSSLYRNIELNESDKLLAKQARQLVAAPALKMSSSNIKTAALLLATGERSADVRRHFGVSKTTLNRSVTQQMIAKTSAELAELKASGQPLPEVPSIIRSARKHVLPVHPNKLKPEQIEIATARLLRGELRTVIATDLGVTQTTLRKTVSPKKIRFLQKQKEANELFLSGKTRPEVQKLIGVSRAELNMLASLEKVRLLLAPIVAEKKRLAREAALVRRQEARAQADAAYIIPPKQADAVRKDLLHGIARSTVARKYSIPPHQLDRHLPAERLIEQRNSMITEALLSGQPRLRVIRAFNTRHKTLDISHPPEVIAARMLELKLEARPAEPVAPSKPHESIIAVPMAAAAANSLMRKGLELPFGWKPEELWQGFIAHNEAVYAAYRKAPATDPLIDRMMIRYGIQRNTPELIAKAERDEYILNHGKEALPGMMREVFMLISKPANGKPASPTLLGELWIDTHKNSQKGVVHTYVMNPQASNQQPKAVDVFMLTADAAARFKPLKAPIRALAMDD